MLKFFILFEVYDAENIKEEDISMYWNFSFFFFTNSFIVAHKKNINGSLFRIEIFS